MPVLTLLVFSKMETADPFSVYYDTFLRDPSRTDFYKTGTKFDANHPTKTSTTTPVPTTTAFEVVGYTIYDHNVFSEPRFSKNGENGDNYLGESSDDNEYFDPQDDRVSYVKGHPEHAVDGNSFQKFLGDYCHPAENVYDADFFVKVEPRIVDTVFIFPRIDAHFNRYEFMKIEIWMSNDVFAERNHCDPKYQYTSVLVQTKINANEPLIFECSRIASATSLTIRNNDRAWETDISISGVQPSETNIIHIAEIQLALRDGPQIKSPPFFEGL